MRSLRFVFLVTTVLFAVPREGLAGNWLARERAAKRACLNGDVDKGVAILTELYIDTDDINYLFNQGRCFEQNRRYEEAIGRFREYLGKGDKLTKKEKAEAETRIARCESYLPKSEPKPPIENKPPVVEAPKPVVPVEQPAPPPPAVEPPKPIAIVPLPQTPPPNSSAGAGMRAGGIVLGVAGAAGIATGVILNLKVNQMSNDLARPDNYSRSTDSSRKTYRTLAWVSYGLGAACLATGSVLYCLGWRKAANSAAIAWAPTVTPDMAGVALEGAF